MNIVSIEQILAAYERASLLGTIPKAKVAEVVGQALGVSAEIVREVVERERVQA